MKRRYKLLIGFIITGIILVVIFFITKDRKVYYLSLGDSLAVGQMPDNSLNKSYGDYIKDYLEDRNILEFYTKGFAKNGYRSIDLLNDVNNNKKIKEGKKEISIKNALIKADIVTVSIGGNDLLYKLNLSSSIDITEFDDIYSYVDEVIGDINKLLFELRKNCKEQIIVLGLYNPFASFSPKLANTVEPVLSYANLKIQDLTKKYDMTFVDMHDMFLANPSYLPTYLEIHPTASGYRAMSKKIISAIDKKTLAK